MSGQARVESVDALKKFRAALCKFAETAAVSLDEADAEIRRMQHWVQHEQQGHWKRQLQKRTELHARAKSALTRKKLMKTPLGGRYSCTEEEKVLAVAERRLEEARKKIENVRKWRRVLDEEGKSYQAVSQGLSLMIQADMPSARAQLDNMIAALEAYATSTAPAAQRSIAAAGEPGESMARGGPPQGDGPFEILRAQTPKSADRAAIPIGDVELDWPITADADAWQDALAELGVPQEPVDDDAKVIFARSVCQSARIYLERVEPAGENDSGWYIGIAGDTPITDFDAVRVADLLTARPDLDALLRLPVGYLAVLARTSLMAVVDPQGARRWPTAPPPGDER